MKVLIVCEMLRVPYRVVRCAAATGATVYVLGSKVSEGLKHSRFVQEFRLGQRVFDGTFGPEMVADVNQAIKDWGIDWVMAGDHSSTRSFHGIKDQLNAKLFPGPDLELFDRLNDKYTFTNDCQEMGIICPTSKLFQTKQELADAIAEGVVALPAIAKPLSLAASDGVVKIGCPSTGAMTGFDKVDYEPILVQEFIEGDDIGASIYCHQGEVRAFIGLSLVGGLFTTFSDPLILENVKKIAAKFHLTGVYNFDMRRRADGRTYYLECNPRIFHKMDLALGAGINFVEIGMSPTPPAELIIVPDMQFHNTRGLFRMAAKPWLLSKRDKQMARYYFGDPVSCARQLLKID